MQRGRQSPSVEQRAWARRARAADTPGVIMPSVLWTERCTSCKGRWAAADWHFHLLSKPTEAENDHVAMNRTHTWAVSPLYAGKFT